MVTAVQNAYALFPEFSYAGYNGKYSTLQLVGGSFFFKNNSASQSNRCIHFIPVWYPNGTQNYTVSAYAYDCWTPAGMIASRASSNSMSIVGSLYDDHYVGRGN